MYIFAYMYMCVYVNMYIHMLMRECLTHMSFQMIKSGWAVSPPPPPPLPRTGAQKGCRKFSQSFIRQWAAAALY